MSPYTSRTPVELERNSAHGLTLKEWGRLLRLLQPKRYRPGGKPRQPTQAAPGTPEKVEVMCRRAERGESLFHDEDLCLVACDHLSRRVAPLRNGSVVCLGMVR